MLWFCVCGVEFACRSSVLCSAGGWCVFCYCSLACVTHVGYTAVRVFLVLGIHILMIKLVVLLFIRGITSSLNTQKLTVTNKYVGLPYTLTKICAARMLCGSRRLQLSIDVSCPRLTSAANPPPVAADAADRRDRRTLGSFMILTAYGWLGSRVVSVLDSGTEGPGFKSQLRRCRVTVLCSHLSSKIGSSPLQGCGA